MVEAHYDEITGELLEALPEWVASNEAAQGGHVHERGHGPNRSGSHQEKRHWDGLDFPPAKRGKM